MLDPQIKKFTPRLQYLLSTNIEKAEILKKEKLRSILLQLQDAKDDATLIQDAAQISLSPEGSAFQELQAIIDDMRAYYRNIAEMVCCETQTEIQRSSTDPDIENASEKVQPQYYPTVVVCNARIDQYRYADYSSSVVAKNNTIEDISSDLLGYKLRIIFKQPIDTIPDWSNTINLIKNALHAQYCGYGNCAEMAWLVALKLLEHGKRLGYIPKFTIVGLHDKDPQDQALMTAADHVFVIINPPDNLFVLENLDDPKLAKLYPASFVIDPMNRSNSQNRVFNLGEFDRVANRILFKSCIFGIYTPLLYKGIPTTSGIYQTTSEVLASLIDSYQYIGSTLLKEDMTAIAKLYYHGSTIPKNFTKAVRFFYAAALQGDADASFYLGICFIKGLGVDVDVVSAVTWLLKAAERNHRGALERLGAFYLYGCGVPKDIAKAFDCYQKAVDLGSANAMIGLAKIYKKGDGVSVTKDIKKAIELLKEAIEKDNLCAAVELGNWFRRGKHGIDQNLNNAISLYKYAMAIGNCRAKGSYRAMCELGRCYEFGIGFAKDLSKAVLLYERVFSNCTFLDEKYPEALYFLAECYKEAHFVEYNLTKAIELYLRAADADYPEALSVLIKFYEKGILAIDDQSQKMSLYESASEAGCGYATYCLAKMAKDIKRDSREAGKLLFLAENQRFFAQKKAGVSSERLIGLTAYPQK